MELPVLNAKDRNKIAKFWLLIFGLLITLDIVLRNSHLDERFLIRSGWIYLHRPEMEPQFFSFFNVFWGYIATISNFSHAWLIICSRIVAISFFVFSIQFLYKSYSKNARRTWCIFSIMVLLDFQQFYYLFQARYDVYLYGCILLLLALLKTSNTKSLSYIALLGFSLLLGPKGLFFALPLMGLAFLLKKEWRRTLIIVSLASIGFIWFAFSTNHNPIWLQHIFTAYQFQGKLASSFGYSFERLSLFTKFLGQNPLFVLSFFAATWSAFKKSDKFNFGLMGVGFAAFVYSITHPFFHPPMLSLCFILFPVVLADSNVFVLRRKWLFAALGLLVSFQIYLNVQFIRKKYFPFNKNNLWFTSNEVSKFDSPNTPAFDPHLFLFRAEPCETIWYIDRTHNEYYKLKNRLQSLSYQNCKIMIFGDSQAYFDQSRLNDIHSQDKNPKIWMFYK